jgi:predicted transposase/invertase (TIGR01784 family)
MASTPHDALFKAAFAQPDLAKSELELVLPSEVRAELDLATLAVCPGSFVDEELQQTHSDVLYAVPLRTGGEGFVYVLLEHQSSSDPLMAFRILRYVVRIWERWLREHPNARTLPIVLPVLLHHGDNAWRGSRELAGLLDASPELVDVTRPFVPHFAFMLDDLAALSPEALSTRALDALPRLVQLALWASRSMPRLKSAVPFMKEIIARLVRDARVRELLTQVFTYVLSTAPADVEEREIRSMLLEVAGPEGQEDVVNAGEQLIAQGRAQGLRAAADTVREALLKALSARGIALSELARTRVASCADVATLTTWLSRAVTASTESAIFAGESAP